MNNQTIGLYQGIALYIAAILGSGVLFLSSVTASIAGPASIMSWIIVILMNIPIAFSFGYLAKLYPDAGGAATFVRKSFGYHLGNLVGWFYFVTGTIGQTIVSLTGAYYLCESISVLNGKTIYMALVILTLAGIFNYLGVKTSGKVALFLSSCLLFLLVTTVVITLPKISWGNFTPFMPNGWFSIGSAITVIFWAFFGWEAICNLAKNFKKPETNIVRSTMISAGIIGVLFLILSFVTIGTATYGNTESNLSPISIMMGETVGLNAKLLTGILAFIICTGTCNAFFASLTQLGYSLSRDGAFPKYFASVDSKSGLPKRMVVFVVFIAMGGVLGTSVLSLTFEDILFIPTSLGILVYILSMAAGLKLMDKSQIAWWTSLVSFISCVLVLPFFKLYIIVPAIITGLYIVYMIIRPKKNEVEQPLYQKINR
ncbi:APC family permease [Halobacillus sp. B23F22_1]|uniref:APC family permease n=1 Tax=Halobacillus sp. B23F22_1 TaxID=3459514 RepID=UPI00373F14A4